MKNYRDSDYAANKYARGIVYRFANETTEITLESYLRDNPDATESDFAELKALSDEIYLEQDRNDYRQTWKDVSLYGMDETEVCCIPSAEIEVIDRPDEAVKQEKRRELGYKALSALTEVQRQRYIQYHVDGFTEMQIAELEGSSHQAVSKSLFWADKKIKKVLADG